MRISIPIFVATLASIFIWLFSIVESRKLLASSYVIEWELGLFSILPITYFIAFALLSVTFFITIFYKKCDILLMVQICLLILFLNLTPSLIEDTARFSTSYSNFKAVDYIYQNGHFEANLNWIHNWPSFSILVNSFAKITNMPADTILLYYPTVFNLLFLLVLLALFRTLFDDTKLSWLAIWFVFIGNWVGQDYFSMQSMGLFMFVMLLFLLFRYMRGQIHEFPLKVVFFILYFYLVSSHLLSSLVLFFIILVLYSTRCLKSRQLILLMILLISCWAIFNAHYYLQGNLLPNLKQALDLSTLFELNISKRIAYGNSFHVFTAQVRLGFSVILLVLAFIGIFYMWVSKQFKYLEKRLFCVIMGILSLLFLCSYGGELFLRLYMFSLIPLAYFAVKVLLKYKTMFIICALFFVIVAPSMHIIAHYGNESVDYVPPSEIVGSNFLFNTAPAGDIYGFFRHHAYHQNYSFIGGAKLFTDSALNSLWVNQDRDNNQFLCVSRFTVAVYDFLVNDPKFLHDIVNNATRTTAYNLVYSNPCFTLYSKT